MDDERTFGKPEVVAASVEKLRIEEKSLTSLIETKKKELEQVNTRFDEATDRLKAQRSDELSKHESTIKSLKDEIHKMEIIIDGERKNLDALIAEQNRVKSVIASEEAKKDKFVSEMTDVNDTAERSKAEASSMIAEQTERETNLVKREADFNEEKANLAKEASAFAMKVAEHESVRIFVQNQEEANKNEAERLALLKIESEGIHESMVKEMDDAKRKNDEADKKLADAMQREAQLNELIQTNEEQKRKNEEQRLGLTKWDEDLKAQEVDLKRRQRLSTLNDSP